MLKKLLSILGAGCLITAAGCVTQHNVLFMTKSNVGMDVDTTPPTAEIAISRRELVIAPTFEGGRQPPVLATFRSDNGQNAASNFAVGGSSTFVGGDAAVWLARMEGQDDPAPICLSAKPTRVQIGNKPSKHTISWPDASTVSPFIFGTDTSLGLKIGYSGTSVAIDTFKLGFNRKEFAKAPIVLSEGTNEEGDCPSGTFRASITPFYAGIERGIDASVSTEGPKTGVRLLQAFATGQAAVDFVQRPSVKRILLERLEPEAEVKTCAQADTESVHTFADKMKWPEQFEVMDAYLEQREIDVISVSFINCAEYEDERAVALADSGLMEALEKAAPAAEPKPDPAPPADVSAPAAPDPAASTPNR